MRPNRTAAVIWAGLWLAVLAIAASGRMDGVDRAVGAALRHIGNAWPVTNLIWVIGGLPLTALAVLGASWRRRSWWIAGGFVAGLLVEVVSKHFLATPFPQATPEPPFFQHLEAATNLSPAWAASVLQHWLHTHPVKGPHHPMFRGSFPSGHVFRITYASGAWMTRRRWTWAVAAAAGVLVIATGGHWLVDVLGGFLLARFWLRLCMPIRRG